MAVVLLSSLAFTQSNPNTDQGLKPYDSFHGGDLDSVSMTSGNLFFHKTEYSAGQRGKAALTYSLQYNNKGLRLQITCNDGTKGPWTMAPGSAPAPAAGGGQGCISSYQWIWQGSGVTLGADQSSSFNFVGCTRVDTGSMDVSGTEIILNVCSAHTPDGAEHQLADTGNGYRSIDASGFSWPGSPSSNPLPAALDRDGIIDDGATDTNGNFLSVDLSNNYTDTLGRVIPPALAAPAQTSTASLSSCPNLNLPYQPLVAAYSWNLPGPTGTSPYILCYASVYIRTALFGTGTYVNSLSEHDVSKSVDMLQSVVRPDGTVWSFTYDGANPNDTTSIAYGDLLKISYPMGGSVTYTWGTEFPYQGQYTNQIQTTSSRSVETRTLDANDGTGPHTWRYSWGHVLVSTLSNYVVENTVTDPLGNDTVHQITGFFGSPSLYETQTSYYQGSQTAGTLLKTVNTDYSFSSNPFDNLGPTAGPPTTTNVVPIHVTTIWPSGQTSRVEMDHDSGFIYRDPKWGQPAPVGPNSNTYPDHTGRRDRQA